MKAIILNEAGTAERLQLTDLAKPEIKDDEVLVRTVSLSVNPVDYKARANDGTLTWLFGSERPAILGWDLSGTIETLGKNVSGFKVGDEVFGMANFPGKGNAYAEYVAVPASHLAIKPSNISHEEAAAATLAALTAWQSLVTRGNIKRGDRVLIHSASGGVGHYAVQIAKHFGAFRIGTSSAKNKEFVLRNGADEHIDYERVSFENEVSDMDLVLNSISNDVNGRSLKVTKSGGKIIYILGEVASEHLESAKNKNIDLLSVLVESSGSDMKSIADLLRSKKIRSHISRTFAFSEMAQAHQQLETGRTVGKIAVQTITISFSS